MIEQTKHGNRIKHTSIAESHAVSNTRLQKMSFKTFFKAAMNFETQIWCDRNAILKKQGATKHNRCHLPLIPTHKQNK